MFVAARMAEQRGELGAMQELLEGSRDLYEQAGDLPGVIFAVAHLGNAAAARGEDAVAREHGTRSTVLARELGDPWYLAMALNNYGFNRVQRGDVGEDTTALLEESLSLRRHLGEQRGVAVTLGSLAELHLIRGALEAAEPLLDEMLQLARALSHAELTCVALNLQGFLELGRNQVERGASLFLESLRRAVDSGHQLLTTEALLGLADVASRRALPARALRVATAALAAENQRGQPLTALHEGVARGVLKRTAVLGEASRDAVVRAAREASLERIVAEVNNWGD